MMSDRLALPTRHKQVSGVGILSGGVISYLRQSINSEINLSKATFWNLKLLMRTGRVENVAKGSIHDEVKLPVLSDVSGTIIVR
jgi:hypothetical protein